uniref:Uncharacterized protein n=1 Tax=Rhizophora mucronata TaxID=61149 RepID=A0A2P2NQG5_RHIMU
MIQSNQYRQSTSVHQAHFPCTLHAATS